MSAFPIMPFLPDLALLALALAVLASDLMGEESSLPFHLSWLGLAGIAAVLIPAAHFSDANIMEWAGYRVVSEGSGWKLLFTLAALGTVLLSRPYLRPGGNARGTLGRPGAFLGLILLCVQGMFALVSATDLLTFYLGLELATLPLFALAAFQPRDAASVEAGTKYVLMGGFSSALTLFGLSFLYGVSGSLDFAALSHAATTAPGEPLLWGGLVFIGGGLGFKLAMAPLHMWVPDVYQGAPTPVTAFLSIGSKAAAVAAVATLFLGPLDPLRTGMSGFFMAAAVLSMVVGNLGAMRQSDLRRFIGYSSIAQVGYMLVALVGDGMAARTGLVYNLLAYGLTSFALFFIMGIIGKEGPETIPALRGLGRRHPGLGVLLVLAMFSLAGIPPLAGFLGKFLIFTAAAQEGHYVLVGIAVANAVVSFYYYMLLVKEAYMAEAPAAPALILGPLRTLALWALAIALLVLGLCPAALGWLTPS